LEPQHYNAYFWDGSITVLIFGTAALECSFWGPQHFIVNFLLPQHYSAHFWDRSFTVLIFETAALECSFLGPQHFIVNFCYLSITVLILGTAEILGPQHYSAQVCACAVCYFSLLYIYWC
jgi:hypothetical protein